MKHIKFAFYSFSMILPLVFIWAGIAAGVDERPITIGILENQQFAYAKMMKNSFVLALTAINRQGGINGRMLKLVYADDGGDKWQGTRAVEDLVLNKKVVMLTGGYSSTNTLSMTQRADDLNMPFLVSTASDDRITRRKRQNIFRLNPPASEYAQGLEQLLQQKLHPKSMAIVYENSPFGTSGATQMMWFCRENDIEITAIIPYHKERAAEGYFDRLLTPLKRNPPQMIYLVAYKRDGVLMVQRIRAARITAHLLGGAGGFTHPEFIKAAGAASSFMMTATLWWADLPYPLARRYARLYRSTYNNEMPDYHGAEAYAALMWPLTHCAAPNLCGPPIFVLPCAKPGWAHPSAMSPLRLTTASNGKTVNRPWSCKPSTVGMNAFGRPIHRWPIWWCRPWISRS